MDTEVYSNTGGQGFQVDTAGCRGQFAAGGKRQPKKDLGMMAMSCGNIYIAQVALSNPAQVVKAFLEADAFDGPSLIIAYSHCIAHGIAMDSAIEGCKEAVSSGHWPLYRFDPRLADQGKNPLQLDSKAPTISFEDYALKQNRYRVLKKVAPEAAQGLIEDANKITSNRYRLYKQMAEMSYGGDEEK